MKTKVEHCLTCDDPEKPYAKAYRYGGDDCQHYCHIPLDPIPDGLYLGQEERCPKCEAVKPVRVSGLGRNPAYVRCKDCGTEFTVQVFFGEDDDD